VIELSLIMSFCFSVQSDCDFVGTEVVHFGTGERLWWTWMHDEFDENFKITEVGKCLAGVPDSGNNRQTSGSSE